MAVGSQRIVARVKGIRPPAAPSYALAAACEQFAAERKTLQEVVSEVAGAYAATQVWRCHGRREQAAAILDINVSELYPKGARKQ
jgi:DNA-binding NtrC family response regulator